METKKAQEVEMDFTRSAADILERAYKIAISKDATPEDRIKGATLTIDTAQVIIHFQADPKKDAKAISELLRIQGEMNDILRELGEPEELIEVTNATSQEALETACTD